ncbi:hypothetical protein PV516_19685 [Streptomyces scabiei]|uniref:hypothetical protein n=1 Tax=Streptomyces scabiei TaxID=1930 RepID=UPI0029B7240B|nr:hypothetical protein [Streptomyces scabiei]MDX3166013.1 hypothetical protein [Streptomyces scabiei]
MTTATRLATYGPFQFPERAGLSVPQFERAQRLGLIPGPDVAGGRWSAAAFDDAVTRVDAIKAAVGTMPDVGANRAEEHLAERFPTVTVHPGTAAELARRRHLPVVGDHKGWPLYCGLTLERFTDRRKVARASAAGQLHTRDAAAAILGIRSADFEHLVRAGLLTHADTTRSYWKDLVLLYRQGDLDRLTRSRRIDWGAVRDTPKGRRSPLAALPTKTTADQ